MERRDAPGVIVGVLLGPARDGARPSVSQIGCTYTIHGMPDPTGETRVELASVIPSELPYVSFPHICSCSN
jgi:hypothetical protein